METFRLIMFVITLPLIIWMFYYTFKWFRRKDWAELFSGIVKTILLSVGAIGLAVLFAAVAAI